jgi:protein SCO1/2
MTRRGSCLWVGISAVLVLSGTLGTSVAVAKPTLDSADLAYHERPGSPVPMNLPFRDADDRVRSLADIAQGRPLILVPAYYDCTSLCGLVRSSLYGALAALTDSGDYALAIVSIDPQETSDSARMAQSHDQHAIDGLHGPQPHYLTGAAPNLQAVTDAVGFRARRDPLSGQFLHPAGVVFLTPRGTVSSYLLGVGYTPAQVRSALQRAQAGVLAQVGAPLLLLCFHFDATTGRYSLEIMKVLRLAGYLTVLTLLGVMVLMFRRERS